MRETTQEAAMTDYQNTLKAIIEWKANPFTARLAIPKTKLQVAKEYAAAVRARKPEMQVRRIAK